MTRHPPGSSEHMHPALLFSDPASWTFPLPLHEGTLDATPHEKGEPCRKGLDPADLGFRGPQWIVLITTMLGAMITVALLAVTSNLFSTTQANVARKGFENFQSVDPLKVRMQLDMQKLTPTHATMIVSFAHAVIK